MQTRNYWKEFENTGRIEDYLSYREQNSAGNKTEAGAENGYGNSARNSVRNRTEASAENGFGNSAGNRTETSAENGFGNSARNSAGNKTEAGAENGFGNSADGAYRVPEGQDREAGGGSCRNLYK